MGVRSFCQCVNKLKTSHLHWICRQYNSHHFRFFSSQTKASLISNKHFLGTWWQTHMRLIKPKQPELVRSSLVQGLRSKQPSASSQFLVTTSRKDTSLERTPCSPVLLIICSTRLPKATLLSFCLSEVYIRLSALVKQAPWSSQSVELGF